MGEASMVVSVKDFFEVFMLLHFRSPVELPMWLKDVTKNTHRLDRILNNAKVRLPGQIITGGGEIGVTPEILTDLTSHGMCLAYVDRLGAEKRVEGGSRISYPVIALSFLREDAIFDPVQDFTDEQFEDIFQLISDHAFSCEVRFDRTQSPPILGIQCMSKSSEASPSTLRHLRVDEEGIFRRKRISDPKL